MMRFDSSLDDKRKSDLWHTKRQISPSLRTDSPKPSDWQFAGVGLTTGIGCRLVLVASGYEMALRAEIKSFSKLPSLPHVTPRKPLCTKGWSHVRDVRSPSRLPHIFSWALPFTAKVRVRDQKREGNVRVNGLLSRPSNALYISLRGLLREYVRDVLM